VSDTINPETLEVLTRVMSASRQRRADRANTALRTLRPYERRLVREAAVMGYVLGRQDGLIKGRQGGSLAFGNGDDFPGDAVVLQNVLEHCDSTDDLYPYLAAACAGRRRRVTKGRLWPGEVAV
jgi:hypothetical protein